ncbi:MAG: hypothetical protein M3Y86_01035 [Verrucomicrobiota bacterium]|nr:hypothetical protein [Verrucomicrobiota bacterium]
MKQNRLFTLLAAGAVSAVALSTSFAQTTTHETTTATGNGTAGVSSTTTTGGTSGVSSSTTTSTSSLDGTGTITTYSPGSDYISMRTESSTAPVKYYYTSKTTVVDPTGATVDMSLLRPDMPVRYTYVKDGDRMVVSKITVEKPVAEITKESTTTTTTTTHK